MTTPPPLGDQPPYGQQPYGQQPPQYPYQPPPQKKRKVWPWVLGGVILVFILLAGGCIALIGGAANEVDKALSSATLTTPDTPSTPGAGPGATTTSERGSNTLVYEVTSDSGTATNITYFTAGGNQSQETSATLPWRSAQLDADQVVLKSVVAQNGGGGTITCKIIVNGEVEVENSSSGQYAVVTCQGRFG